MAPITTAAVTFNDYYYSLWGSMVWGVDVWGYISQTDTFGSISNGTDSFSTLTVSATDWTSI